MENHDTVTKTSRSFFHCLGGRGSCWIIGMVVLAVLVAGFWISKKSGEEADLQLRRELVRQVASIAATVNPDSIRTLSFTSKDRDRPVFRLLRNQLALYAEAAGLHSLYIMALRDGQIVFGPGSFPDGHPSASSPGTVYQQPTQKDFDLFKTAQPQIQGPVSDEYGTYMVSLAPVVDRATGEVLAVVGINVEAREWQAAVRRAQWIPGGITLGLVAILFFSGLILRLRQRLPVACAIRMRHAEPVFCTIFMLALTMALASHFSQVEYNARRNTFYSIAQMRAEASAARFHDMNLMLEQLAAFFEASDWVSAADFSTYCRKFMQTGTMDGNIWVPSVPNESVNDFIQIARNEGLTDFSIWQRSADGLREPVSVRPLYYPVLYMEPVRAQAVPGFDELSDPVCAAAIQQALNTGLSAATDPLVLTQTSAPKSAFLVFKMVHAINQKGAVGFTVLPERLLGGVGPGGQKAELNVCLSQLVPKKDPFLLAGSSAAFGRKCRQENGSGLSLTVPIFRFGKVYVLQLVPEADWLAAHPLHSGRNVVWLGVLGTLLVSSLVGLVTNRQVKLEKLVDRRAQELKESETRFRDIIVNSSDWVWEVDARGFYTYASEKVAALLGYEPEEIIGKTPFDLMTPEQAVISKEFFSGIVRNRLSFRDHEKWNLCKDGTPVCLLSSGVPVFSAEGTLAGYRGSDTDITGRKKMEEALSVSEKKFRSVVEDLLVGVVVHDADSHILWSNPQAQKILGVSAEEMSDKAADDPSWRFVCEDLSPMKVADYPANRVLSTGTNVVNQILGIQRADSEEIKWVAVSAVPVFSGKNELDRVVVNFMDITDRKLAEARIRNLVNHLETVREEERKRLSRELHDDIGQILTALKIDLVMIGGECSCGDGVHEKITDMQKLLSEGIQSVHSLCRRLRPGALDDLSLADAIDGLIDDWQQRNQIECTLSADVDDDTLSDEIKTMVFRMVQEALTNVSRYAQASKVEIHLVADEQSLNICISDNGCGMQPGAADKPTSFGLMGMRERLEALEGTLCIESAPGKGTRIEATAPIKK